MDWEEMKHTWQEMSVLREEESFLSEEYLRNLSHRKSQSGLRRIVFFECIGLLMSLLMLAYLLFHWPELQTWLDFIGGYGTLSVLLISLAFGLRLIRQMLKINIQKNSYSQTLRDFAAFKKSLRFYKNMSIAVAFILPIFMLPLISKFYFGKDLLEDWQDFTQALLYSFLLLPLLLYLIFRFYKGNVRKVSSALQDMEENR